MTRKTTFEEFKELATAKHEGKYLYRLQEYGGNASKVAITCQQHGEFFQIANDHIRGSGCPICARLSSAEKAKSKWAAHLEQIKSISPQYDYSRFKDTFTKVTEKVVVICQHHGEFAISPNKLKKGQGCVECGTARATDARKVKLPEFLERAEALHGRTYDYSKVEYTDYVTPVTLVCSVHGDFQQTPLAHVQHGAGCRKCASLANSQTVKVSHSQFLQRASELHGNRYAYPTEIASITQPVEISCSVHGSFWQAPYAHLRGQGCAKCVSTISKGQVEVLEYVKSLGFTDAVLDYRYGESRREFDVYIPSKKFGIEFDGVYFHSSKFKSNGYHAEKLKEAEEAGVTLVQIFSDQWEFANNQAKALLASRLGVSSRGTFARYCKIAEISNEEARSFHEKYHIQGWKRNGTNVALILDSEIVAVMTFTSIYSKRGEVSNPGEFELARFSSKLRVVGGASKLFSYFVKFYKAKKVVSYSDNRLFSGGMYGSLGFLREGVTQPSYTYVVQGRRVHKSHFRHSNLAKVLGEAYDPAKTEREICENAGYYQVYDSGLTRWVWNTMEKLA